MALYPLGLLAGDPDPNAPPDLGVTGGRGRHFLVYAAGADEGGVWAIRRPAGSGFSLKIQWSADTATSGDVVFGAQVMAVTPDVDTDDMQTDDFGTAVTVTDSHLGTTAGRLHDASLSIPDIDSAAEDDYIAIRIYRNGAAAGDTLVGDVHVWLFDLDYTP